MPGGEANGKNFTLNGVYFNNVVTFPWNDNVDDFPSDIRHWVERSGGEVVLLDFSEYGKIGAGHKCVSLFLN